MIEVDVMTLQRQAQTFHARIRRRNLLEMFAAGLGVALFGSAALTAGDLVLQVSSGAVVLGTLVVAWVLGTRGEAPVAEPASTTAEFLAQRRAELLYQAELLEAVPLWYVGPLLPGLGGMLLYGAWRGAWGPLWANAAVLIVAAVFLGWVVWANRAAARALRAEADALPEVG